MKRISTTLIIILLAALLLTACGPTGLSFQLPSSVSSARAQAETQAPVSAPLVQQQPTALPVATTSNGVLASLQGTLEQIHNKVTPSIVNINVSTRAAASGQRTPSLPNNQQVPPLQEGSGSGFVWDKAGHIVTNNHVIDGAEKITITFSDGFSTAGKVVGQDRNSDLAVLKVDVPETMLQPVQMADSNQLKVGQLAIAIGNPFGLEGTMTLGIVSALGRSLPVESTTTSRASYSIPDIIQTDAPINPGNSGGVLVNDLGQVIGVTSAIESPVRASVGIGYAVPSAIVQRVVPSLIQSGKYSYPWLGISGTELNSDIIREMKLAPETRGVLVSEVTKGSPSEKAGLKGSGREITLDNGTMMVGGDIITAVDGQVVRRFNDLVGYLVRATMVGQKIELTVLRDGQQQKVQVVLAARPE